MNVQIAPLELNAINMESSGKVQKANTDNNEEKFSSVLNGVQSKKESTENVAQENKKSVLARSRKAEDATKVITEDINTDNLLNQVTEGLLDEEAVIKVIADIFQKSTDEIEQILAALQIGIMDLLQMDNLQQLVMQVYNVEEPMDLLMIPEVSEAIKTMVKVLEEYVAQSPTVIEETTQSLEYVKTPISNGLVVEDGGKETKKLDEPNKIVETKPITINDSTLKVKQKEELLSSQDQQSPGQGTSPDKFIQNLSQAMGDVFQWQQEQVSGIKEAVTSKDTLVEPRLILDQIVEKIKTSVNDEKSQISIQLKPEHLGRLSMKIVSEQGVMTAHFTVENEKTKTMIEQHIQELQEVLENKGITINKLEVTVGENQQDEEQLNEKPRVSKNISKIIANIMNENLDDTDLQVKESYEYETNEVNFIA